MDKFLLLGVMGMLTIFAGFEHLAIAQEFPDIPKVVETVGQNYDLTENYIIGEATWTSHPPRIMFDGWKDFAVIESGSSIQVASESIGTVVYDKNSCSYSMTDHEKLTKFHARS